MRHLPETIRTRALGLQARLAAVPGRALAAAVTLTVVVSLGALLTATVVAQPAPAPLAALETPAVSTPTATPTLTAPSPAPTSTPAPTATSTPAPAATQSSGEQPYVAARRIGTGPGDVPVFEVKFYDFPEGTSAVWESITAADGRVVPVGKTITIARSGHTILETITGVSARFLIGERRFDVRTDPGSTAWSTARGVAPVAVPVAIAPPVATAAPPSPAPATPRQSAVTQPTAPLVCVRGAAKLAIVPAVVKAGDEFDIVVFGLCPGDTTQYIRELLNDGRVLSQPAQTPVWTASASDTRWRPDGAYYLSNGHRFLTGIHVFEWRINGVLHTTQVVVLPG